MAPLTLLASVSLYYVNAPVIEMREKPSVDSEMASQAYYTEQVKILETTPNWLKIETTADHYSGWIANQGLYKRETPFPASPQSIMVKVNRCSAHLYHAEDTVFGPILTVPFDSKFEVLEPKENSNSRWLKVSLVDEKEAYIQRGDITFSNDLLNVNQMCDLSLQFLDLPYTYGGRSSFGYDCSGFVQMLYRQMGVSLPRDSKDQHKWEGFKSIALEALSPGDLIFFGLEVDKIRHVGLYLGNQRFIHANVLENRPYIIISDLSFPEWNGSGRLAYRAARTLKK